MAPCPFGFSAAAEAEAPEAEEQEADDEGPVFCAGEMAEDTLADGSTQREQAQGSKAKSKKKKGSKGSAPKKGEDRFNFDTDPVSWFYQNQIKSEEDFQARKADLRAEARRRLDAIMAKKQQQILWPSDSEFDDISISSGELSDLDSDVHSMHSLKSCAASWEEDARFTRPAETTTYWAALCTMALSVWTMYISYQAYAYSNRVMGVLLQAQWPWYAVICAAAMALTGGCMLAGTHFRSKRLVLAGQVMSILAYGVAMLLTVQLFLQPLQVDTDLTEKACTKLSDSDRGSRLCQMLPHVQDRIAFSLERLKLGMAGLSGLAIVLAALGAWYVVEISFVEKKAIKHLKRHKRNKHRIPWEKIKIEGPVTSCGAASGGAAGKGSASKGKCPVMH